MSAKLEKMYERALAASRMPGALPSARNVDRGKLAAAAQKVYDDWDASDEEWGDAEVGFGGICQDIADAMVTALDQQGIESKPLSAAVGEQHVFVVAKLREGIYEVDIPPYVYESGGGYSWKKLPDVRFEPGDVTLTKLSSNPEDFDEYGDE